MLKKLVVIAFLALALSAWVSSNEPDPTVTITLADAQKVSDGCRVNGVRFKFPISYAYRDYSKKIHGWPNVPKKLHDGVIAWREVDFLNIQVLYPDLEPITKANYKEFEVLGVGRMITIHLTHFRPWDYYFENTHPQKKKLSEDPKVPGMSHYYWRSDDEYYSHDVNNPDLVMVSCPDQNVYKHPSPSCSVVSAYRPAADIIELEGMEGAIFRLEYSFSASYLTNWREIDAKVKKVFDQFIREANKTPDEQI